MNRILKKLQLFTVILFCCIASFHSAIASSESKKDWRFKVFLDGDEIGTHNFSVRDNGLQREIKTNARFDVSFLLINLYSYQHENVERWTGQCLNSIEAFTNDNGEELKVSGKIDNDTFIVNTLAEKHVYEPCIKTFAYWDPEFLNESTLLNSQTGELIEISSQFVGNDNLIIKGQSIDAKHYQLIGDNLQIDLWYTEDDHWLQLESLTEGGRVVKYALYADSDTENAQ